VQGAPTQTSGPARSEDESAQVDVIAQLLRIVAILRRRWLVVAVTTVLCVAAAALSIRLLEPRWRASASIVIPMGGPQVLDKIEGVGEDAEARVVGYKEYYQTQRQILGSRTVAKDALDSLGLAEDPQFLGVDHIDDEAELAREMEEIDPVERLRELVNIDEVRNSRIVEISAEYPDREIARDIANAVADAYMAHVKSSRSRVGDQAKGDIAGERKQAMERVRGAEGELEAFKKQNSITSIAMSDRENEITENILVLTKQSKEASSERDRLQRMAAQAKALHKKDQLAAAYLLPEDQRSVFEEMRKEQLLAEAAFGDIDVEYGPKHEEHRKAKNKLDMIQAGIEREANTLIASLESQLTAVQEHEQYLRGSLDRERKRALALGGLEREYRELEREAKVAAEEYLLVARRDTEIGLTNRVEAEGIEILDRASAPSEPVFPPKGMLLALGLVAGLGLGSVLALSIDFRDSRLRGLLDLERALAPFGVPVLGQLPLLSADSRLGAGNARAQRRQRDLYAHLFPQSLMAERCRGIRTSIAFVQGNEPAKAIMITSPSSSEGKSSTAMNLALSFCQAGKKVLIVDGDMRRPRVHQIFDFDGDTAGLAAVLVGERALDDAIVRGLEGAPENLAVLPCGKLPDNPAELLDSAPLRRLLADLRERFDIVILDSPPVLPVADPLILAGKVDGVVVVTRCDQTTRGELQRALSQLAQGDANMLGVVLNEVDARAERYDYGGGYYTYRPRDRETGTD
jgi:capsular exopolysaccharide synthesis family protein